MEGDAEPRVARYFELVGRRVSIRAGGNAMHGWSSAFS